MADKRTGSRIDWNMPATIETGHGGRIECLVRDLSRDGACIAFIDPAKLPDRFVLHLGSAGELPRRCAVAWRGEAEVGVKFVQAGFAQWTAPAERAELDC